MNQRPAEQRVEALVARAKRAPKGDMAVFEFYRDELKLYGLTGEQVRIVSGRLAQILKVKQKKVRHNINRGIYHV